jgi:exonuclease VII small subunit
MPRKPQAKGLLPASRPASMEERRRRVDRALEQWKAAAKELERHGQRLEQAMEAYSRGAGPLPRDLVEEVATMQNLVNILFDELAAAVRERSTFGNGA